MNIGAFLGKRTKLGKHIVQETVKSLGVNTLNTSIFTSSYVANGTPVWRNLSELSYLLDCYCDNFVVQAIINIKANAFSNMKFKVRDLKSGEIIPLEEYDKDKGKLKKLLTKPNPLQSSYEWLRQYKVNHEVFGNAYNYASVPVGYESNFSYEDITVINNLAPYCMTPVLTGKWLDVEHKSDIIKEYKFSQINGRDRYFQPNTIFHTNNANIKSDENFTQGRSDLIALQRPISNIDAAFESRNVLIRKRGALGILTPEKKDEAMGSLPLNDDEIKEVQEAFSKYGLLDNQYSQIISPQPLKYQKMASSVRDLMLFEEIESDAIAIANSKGVPELLAKYYLKGGTFKNLDASEKRLYDSTIIPEAKDFVLGLNNFFRTEESGIELIGSFDHLNILQVNKQEEATTKQLRQETALAAFKIGAIKFNDYLNAIDMPIDSEIGEKRIWDLNDKQLLAIGITTNTQNYGG